MHIVIDGNEANSPNRVGSNVYAFEMITALCQLAIKKKHHVTVVLRDPPQADLPQPSEFVHLKSFGPQRFWTQWALPKHLHQQADTYDLFFTPGHYAPKLCPIPYISSVMDTAYLDFPQQFTFKDRLQLQRWTQHSVKHAKKVVCISQHTKQQVHQHYHKPLEDLVVAYPGLPRPAKPLSKKAKKIFYQDHSIKEPYFLFVGTVQPRKNIPTLIKAYELFSTRLTQKALEKQKTLKYSKLNKTPQLVLAGKIGWLAEESLDAIEQSQLSERIITTGFVTNQQKATLLESASATVLVGLHEGFGLPPLESLAAGTPVVVSKSSSLPEVVGSAGAIVDPTSPDEIAQALLKVYLLSSYKKRILKKHARKQAAKFSWESSANVILQACESVVTKV